MCRDIDNGIDLIIREEDLEAAQSVASACGYNIPAGEIPLKPGTDRAGMIFRVSKVVGNELLPLDLMLVTPAYEPVWRHRSQVLFGKAQVPVISKPGMIIMKQLGGRPKDQLDLQFLTGNTHGLTPED